MKESKRAATTSLSAVGAAPHLPRARGGVPGAGERLLLLLLRGATGRRSPGRTERRTSSQVRRAMPPHSARRGAATRRAGRDGGHPPARAGGARRRLSRRGAWRRALQHRRHRRSGPRAFRRSPRLQLRRHSCTVMPSSSARRRNGSSGCWFRGISHESVRLFEAAARQEFTMPLRLDDAEELAWFVRQRRTLDGGRRRRRLPAIQERRSAVSRTPIPSDVSVVEEGG